MAARTVCEVDLKTLTDNVAALRKRVAPCRLLCVVKADAYGLGAVPVARALKAAGAARLGVATLDEALELADVGLPVQILGVLFPDELPEAVARGIVAPVADVATAEALSAEAVRQNRTVKVQFKLDTGMGRLGFRPEVAVGQITRLSRLPNLETEGLYSHFPAANIPDDPRNHAQIAEFVRLAAELARCGVQPPLVHLAAGDAICNYPDTFRQPFTMVRPGQILYGLGGNANFDCSPVVTLKTRIGAIREMPAGSSISYSRTHIMPRDGRVAVLAAGYADGVPVALTNCGRVLIGGVSCPIIGRVTMDYTMVDVTDAPAAQAGDTAVFLGGQGADAIRVEEWAELKKVPTQDILCAIGRRVQRIYC